MVQTYDVRLGMNDFATILLAEDREDDIVLVQKAFKRGGIRNPLFVVRNGEEAINYLAGAGDYFDRVRYPLPSLLLLDLKMPRIDGFEVLRWIRTQPSLSALRVVVLTSSQDIRDVKEAYELGATSFLVKPLDFHDAITLAEAITDKWLRLKKAVPPRENSQVSRTESGAN